MNGSIMNAKLAFPVPPQLIGSSQLGSANGISLPIAPFFFFSLCSALTAILRGWHLTMVLQQSNSLKTVRTH